MFDLQNKTLTFVTYNIISIFLDKKYWYYQKVLFLLTFKVLLHCQIFPSNLLSILAVHLLQANIGHILNTYPTPFRYLMDQSNMIDDMLRLSDLFLKQMQVWTTFEEKYLQCKQTFFFPIVLSNCYEMNKMIICFCFYKHQWLW